MWQRFITWLDDIALTDPLQIQQGRIVSRLYLILLFSGFLSLPLLFTDASPSGAEIFYIPALVFGFVAYPVAIWQIRRGHFTRGVLIGVCGLATLDILFAIPNGVLRSPTTTLSLTIPVIIAGLLISRRAMVVMLVTALSALTIIALLEHNRILTPIYAANSTVSDLTVAIFAMTLLFSILGTVIGLFGATLRETLFSAQSRAGELEQLRAGLERTVQDRTASLQHALAEMEQREQRLTLTLAELQASRETIRDLSAPVLPVLPQVLVAPLVGALDEQRIDAFADNLLRAVERERARHVILDITGVPLVDTQVAQTLLRAADSVRLLGGQALLVGVRPEVAQTLVSLGVDLSRLPTFPDLREAVASLVRPASA